MLLLSLSAPLFAQDYRVELFGGYVNQRGDGEVKRDGWIASETVYIRPWIGVTAEFAGLYASNEGRFNAATPVVLDDDQQSYLFGPRFKLFTRGAFTVSGHGLLGVGHRERSFVYFEGDASRFTKLTDYDLAGAAGLTVDVRITDRLAWRIQPDWFFYGSPDRKNSLRLGTGLVFRFGH